MTISDLKLGPYHLSFDEETGLLKGLKHENGPQTLGHGDGRAPLSADLAWQPLTTGYRFISHEITDSSISVTIEQGPLHLIDTYYLGDGLLYRRVRVVNLSDTEQQLTGLRIGLGGVAVGDPQNCLFDAPANAIRPRLPLETVARQPRGASASQPYASATSRIMDTDYAPGSQDAFGFTFGFAPDVGPGLMVVHSPHESVNLVTWYEGIEESGEPWVSGDGTYALLGYDLWLAAWLAPGASVESGAQAIGLVEGPYEAALATYQRALMARISPTLYGSVSRARDLTGIYEVHPGQFGGFDGLRKTLPRIQHMALDTLYLLPIFAHRNKTGKPWDENWESVGSPYATLDYEELEPSLGNEAQFEALIDSIQALGMRALIDFVPQGSALEARYVTEHPEWYARDEEGNMVHSHGWNDTWSFDWANPEYQQFMIGWATRLLKKYDIGGFRIDAPHAKEANWDRTIPYHASHTNLGARSMLEDLRKAINDIKPSATMMCELFGPMWAYSHDIACDYFPFSMIMQLYTGRISPYEFNQYMQDYWAIMPADEDGTPMARICFTETHDTRSGAPYALRGSAVSRTMLGVLVMAGFTPMIWSGQERGQEDFIQGLMLARRENATLRRGKFLFNEIGIDDKGHYRASETPRPAEAVYSVIRYDDSAVLLGLASFFPEKVTYRLSLPIDQLPLNPEGRYQLRELITFKLWDENGQISWTGEELKAMDITPIRFTPYIFRIEAVEGD